MELIYVGKVKSGKIMAYSTTEWLTLSALMHHCNLCCHLHIETVGCRRVEEEGVNEARIVQQVTVMFVQFDKPPMHHWRFDIMKEDRLDRAISEHRKEQKC